MKKDIYQLREEYLKIFPDADDPLGAVMSIGEEETARCLTEAIEKRKELVVIDPEDGIIDGAILKFK